MWYLTLPPFFSKVDARRAKNPAVDVKCAVISTFTKMLVKAKHANFIVKDDKSCKLYRERRQVMQTYPKHLEKLPVIGRKRPITYFN